MSRLTVNELKTELKAGGKVFPAVDGVSFSVEDGETVCIVGESGCGKSMTAFSIMRLLPKNSLHAISGSIVYDGRELLSLREKDMRGMRGNAISMIYQEPMTSLNPVYTIGWQICESIRIHGGVSKQAAREKAVEMLGLVGIPDPASRLGSYPHELSGGMRQRVMIAMALCASPGLLIADEPTTALDVTIQAQILALLRDLKQKIGMSMLFITHDLGVVSEIADRVIVMYGGKIVEEGKTRDLFAHPLHPYTKGLLSCIPTMDGEKGVLPVIRGVLPAAGHYPKGCRFSNRCDLVRDICLAKEPTLAGSEGRTCACFMAEGNLEAGDAS
ncbi:MAG: ABC transporter ATP-binding protein [Oscillospiraceae bacterium]|jgi:oligopeptide/dipeptide ABC transporter ATP-binding protein|nr:ABC transporter ATP-binding protein [Oscillospiraceae bacterium]